MSQEQRKHRRMDEYIRVVIQPTGTPEEGMEHPETTCALRDLSEGGVCLAVDEPLPVGTELHLHMVIDRAYGDSQYLNAIGVVRRVTDLETEVELGVEFTYLPEDSRTILDDHFQRRRPSGL